MKTSDGKISGGYEGVLGANGTPKSVLLELEENPVAFGLRSDEIEDLIR